MSSNSCQGAPHTFDFADGGESTLDETDVGALNAADCAAASAAAAFGETEHVAELPSNSGRRQLSNTPSVRYQGSSGGFQGGSLATPKKQRLSGVVFKLADVEDKGMQKELRAFDRNNDGSLTLEEVISGARDLQTSQANAKLLKQLMAMLLVVVIIVIGVVVGLTSYIVAVNQISKYDSSNQLLNKDNGEPVSVSQSMTRIPLGALHLFPDSLATLKDITYSDPTTGTLHIKSVDSISLSTVNVLTMVTTDGVTVVVDGIEARFSYNTKVKTFIFESQSTGAIPATDMNTSAYPGWNLGDLDNESFIDDGNSTSAYAEELHAYQLAITNVTNNSTAVEVVQDKLVTFSICSACSSCASHSFPTTPSLTSAMEAYYSGLDVGVCTAFSPAVSAASTAKPDSAATSSNSTSSSGALRRSIAEEGRRRTTSDGGRGSIALSTNYICLPRSPPPPTDEFDVLDSFQPSGKCRYGCASWENVNADGNAISQSTVDAKFASVSDRQRYEYLGSTIPRVRSCMRPAFDKDSGYWCYCKNAATAGQRNLCTINSLDKISAATDYAPVGCKNGCAAWKNVAGDGNSVAQSDVDSKWGSLYTQEKDAGRNCAQPYNDPRAGPWCYCANATTPGQTTLCSALPVDTVPDSSLIPDTCKFGCASWTNLARDGNGFNQATANAKWYSVDEATKAGSFCALPYYDRNKATGSVPWCFCKNAATAGQWSPCRAKTDLVYPMTGLKGDYVQYGCDNGCATWSNLAKDGYGTGAASEQNYVNAKWSSLFVMQGAGNSCAMPYKDPDFGVAPWCYCAKASTGSWTYCYRDRIYPTMKAPSSCPLGCAKWSDLRSDNVAYAVVNQVNSMWDSQKAQEKAGNSCAQPFRNSDPPSSPWCVCKMVDINAGEGGPTSFLSINDEPDSVLKISLRAIQSTAQLWGTCTN